MPVVYFKGYPVLFQAVANVRRDSNTNEDPVGFGKLTVRILLDESKRYTFLLGFLVSQQKLAQAFHPTIEPMLDKDSNTVTLKVKECGRAAVHGKVKEVIFRNFYFQFENIKQAETFYIISGLAPSVRDAIRTSHIFYEESTEENVQQEGKEEDDHYTYPLVGPWDVRAALDKQIIERLAASNKVKTVDEFFEDLHLERDSDSDDEQDSNDVEDSNNSDGESEDDLDTSKEEDGSSGEDNNDLSTDASDDEGLQNTQTMSDYAFYKKE